MPLFAMAPPLSPIEQLFLAAVVVFLVGWGMVTLRMWNRDQAPDHLAWALGFAVLFVFLHSLAEYLFDSFTMQRSNRFSSVVYGFAGAILATWLPVPKPNEPARKEDAPTEPDQE